MLRFHAKSTYTNFQAILINDRSKDLSSEIAQNNNYKNIILKYMYTIYTSCENKRDNNIGIDCIESKANKSEIPIRNENTESKIASKIILTIY